MKHWFGSRRAAVAPRVVRQDRRHRPEAEGLPPRQLLATMPIVAGAGQIAAGAVSYSLTSDGNFTESVGGKAIAVQSNVAKATKAGSYVFELQQNGNLYRTPIGTTQSTQISSQIGQIAVDGTGTLNALSLADQHVYRLNGGTTWQNIQPYDASSQIAADGSGNLYALSCVDHKVYRYSGSGSGWQPTNPYDNYAAIAVDAGGTLYALSGTNHQVVRYAGGYSWPSVNPYDVYSQIAVDAGGTLYALSATSPDISSVVSVMACAVA